MSGRQIYTLPSKKEMRRRLRTVDDSYHVVQYLHPLIILNLKNVGPQLYAEGIVLGLNLAIAKYAAPFPHLTSNILSVWLRRYIVALVGDKRIRKQALEVYEGIFR